MLWLTEQERDITVCCTLLKYESLDWGEEAVYRQHSPAYMWMLPGITKKVLIASPQMTVTVPNPRKEKVTVFGMLDFGLGEKK